MGKVTIMASGIGRPVEVSDGDVGRFHCFGTDFEQLDSGLAQYPVAIIELDNGTLRIVPVQWVKFLDRE